MVNRRQSQRRLLLLPPVVVSVGRSKSDVLFDLSEGGLSIYGVVPAGDKESFPIEFRLSGNIDSIRTRGQVAWTSKSRNLTGMRFIGLTEKSRLQLRDWMATRLRPVPSYLAGYRRNRLTPRPQFIDPLRKGAERSNYLGKSGLAIGVLVGVMFFCGLEVRHYYSKLEQKGERPHVVPAMPQARPEVTNLSPNTSVENVWPSTSKASSAPGFVLQVGAMNEQRHADALSNSLQQRGFPVILFKSTTDSFIRVAVGPYPDMSSVLRVKNELKAQNFESFVKRWPPE